MVVARLVTLVALAGCGSAPPTVEAPGSAGDHGIVNHQQFSEDESARAADKAELERVLASEQAALDAAQKHADATASDPAGDGDALRVELADLAVRRRFVATLETCHRDGKQCPPRLDDPSASWTWDPASAAPPSYRGKALRFDLDSWRKLADDLHGRACACRTSACVATLEAVLDELELRPMPEVDQDEAAATSVTRARECLFRLRR